MRKLITGLSIAVLMVILPNLTYAQTASNQAVTDEIMAMVKAQWTAMFAEPANMVEADKNMADDYTEFNPAYATRIDGKALRTRFAEADLKGPGKRVVSEMLNPKVQVYGDAAVLTYNFAGINKNKDGEMKPMRSKVTRVYAKVGGKWKLVHANFALDPMPD